jgi:hypothetical protein
MLASCAAIDQPPLLDLVIPVPIEMSVFEQNLTGASPKFHLRPHSVYSA